MSKSFVAATLAALAVASAASGAVVLADWTFEVSIPATAGPFAAELGANAASSFATGSHSNTATVYSSPVGNGSIHSFSSNTWTVGDFYQFTTSTVGYQNVSFSWDQTGSNTGPRDFAVIYSTDGGATFSNLVAAYAVLANSPAWSTVTGYQPAYTFSASAAGLDNVANLIVRIKNTSTVAINLGVVGTGGTDRVDNVTIAGDLVPTPGSASLIGLGALAAMRRRR